MDSGVVALSKIHWCILHIAYCILHIAHWMLHVASCKCNIFLMNYWLCCQKIQWLCCHFVISSFGYNGYVAHLNWQHRHHQIVFSCTMFVNDNMDTDRNWGCLCCHGNTDFVRVGVNPKNFVYFSFVSKFDANSSSCRCTWLVLTLHYNCIARNKSDNTHNFFW